LFWPPRSAAPEAQAQQIFIYPNRGQSMEQENQDKFACSQWATQQTGFNPMSAQAGPPMPMGEGPPGAGGEAARGAAVGAIGGAIGGNAGKGAAIGAAAGALFGGFRRREWEMQQQQEEASYQQQANAERSNYDRAYSLCLQGRGYGVSD
jgi:hypothetical protein